MVVDFFEELKWRGMLHSYTEGVEQHLRTSSVTAYIGFDPTAPSLHVGSLLPIMGLVHLQRAGHHPIAIAGGGTGMIGDPSGKSQERKLLSREDIEVNLTGIRKQLARFLDFTTTKNPARILNNADWLASITLMEFLRDTGKHFSINEMLAKESVKSRIEKEQGMSFTEFSYSLLQSYDFFELHRTQGCSLQMGGSDQWGNIVSGIDLIRRKGGTDAFGIVYPLITTSSGVKFGKSESGTVWLDAERTSPYRFYQFWLNTDDRDVVKYLKFFTLLDREEIASLEQLHSTTPERREVHRRLAREITSTVHGREALAQALKASGILFGGEIGDIDEQELLDIFEDVPSSDCPKVRLEGEGMSLVELLTMASVAKSRGEARRLLEGGGIYLNNQRISGVERNVTTADLIRGKFLVLRKGGKSYVLVRVG
jgi:tyrosyl-tRNA synthetase